MDLTTWLIFVLAETALIVTPGPAVIYVFSRGLAGRGAAPIFNATMGVVTGNTVYFVLSATGLGALIATSQELFFAVKWIGAAYLVWLGLSAWRAKASHLSADPAAGHRPGHVFRTGAVVQLANPKILVFFIAILPLFIDPAGNVPLQVLILGITSQVLEFTILMLYGLMAAHVSGWARSPRTIRWLDRTAGSLLVAVGIGLAFAKQDAIALGARGR